MRKFKSFPRSVNSFEFIVCAVMVISLTIAFTFVYDLAHTSNCSLAYLYGHISDFYDYNVNVRGAETIVYYPTIYIFYAIWNIPLRIMGITAITGNDAGLLIWEKGLGLLFLFIIYCLTYKLVIKITHNAIFASNSLCVLLAGIPIFLLFEFAWGLYDTVWLAFLLSGIYSFSKENIKRNIIWGILFFAVAVTLKSFVLFLIIPILCYKIKKMHQLILCGAGVMSLYVIETLAYWHSNYFSNNVLFPLDNGFLINALFNVSLGRFSVFLCVFIVGGVI